MTNVCRITLAMAAIAHGMTVSQAAKLAGLHRSAFYNSRRLRTLVGVRDVGWEPTPAEIAAECEAIRAGWTNWTRRTRLVGSPRAFAIPELRMPTFG